MGDIHVRKRGEKWYYSFEVASVDGKRKRIERVGGTRKSDALAKGIQALNEYNNAGQHFEPSTISVADFLDIYMEQHSLVNNRYNTLLGYTGVIETHLKPVFGSYRLSALTVGVIQEFITKKLKEGLARSTVKNIIAPLSQAYEYAITLDYVRENPCKHITYPKGFKKEKQRTLVTQEQYQQILNALSNKCFKMAVMIAWYTGLRISEVYALTWDDIDFTNNTITVNKQVVKRNYGIEIRRVLKEKGKKEERSAWYFQEPKTVKSNRTIAVSPDLITELKGWQQEQEHFANEYGEFYQELYLKKEQDEKMRDIYRIIPVEKSVPCTLPIARMIFRNENGSYSSTDSFKYASRVIHNKLGFKEFDFHSLRHTHATMLIEAGVSPKTVQERLGHEKIETTFNRYVHNTGKMQNDAVEIFDNILKSAIM